MVATNGVIRAKEAGVVCVTQLRVFEKPLDVVSFDEPAITGNHHPHCALKSMVANDTHAAVPRAGDGGVMNIMDVIAHDLHVTAPARHAYAIRPACERGGDGNVEAFNAEIVAPCRVRPPDIH